MKVIKPFFLGVLVGFGLALALLVGLFFTPLREDLFFRLDPEMADIRSKLDRYQEWLAQTDLRIAGQESAAGGNAHAADSLRNAQTKAWRDYKGWRNRLGELARTQARPTADGFWPWTYSLRFWILPIGVFLALLGGVLSAFMARPVIGRSGSKSGRVKPGKDRARPPKGWGQSPDGREPEVQARARAMSDFEAAIKKVARISESDRGNEVPTDPISASAYRETPEAGKVLSPHADAPKGKEPETVSLPLVPPEPGKPPADAGRETHFIQVGPGWGESLNLPGERIGASGPAPKSPLSMEDEDVADARMAAKTGAAPEDGGGDPPAGFMPPTTEVERVERRKEEVLKLARKGMTSSEISRRMRISQDQVEFIIRLRREKG